MDGFWALSLSERHYLYAVLMANRPAASVNDCVAFSIDLMLDSHKPETVYRGINNGLLRRLQSELAGFAHVRVRPANFSVSYHSGETNQLWDRAYQLEYYQRHGLIFI